MIKHIVFFKLKDQAAGATRSENLQALKNKLEKLPGRINVIRAFEVGVNLLQNQDGYDLALYSSFEDQAALNCYRDHPAHQEVVTFIDNITTGRTAVDYED